MDANTERSLGRIEGKLDGIGEALRAHVEQDARRFETVFSALKSHAEDINQAKGAKGAIVLIAGGIAGAVSLVVAAAPYILK